MTARERLALFSAALWWGSLSAVGFLVVPMLFAHLGTPAAAGAMAARLFAAQSWVGVGCGLVLLVCSRERGAEARIGWAGGALLFVVAGMLLALLSEFAVAPRIVSRENLKVWHSVGSAMYFLQWVCAGVVLWKVAGAKD